MATRRFLARMTAIALLAEVLFPPFDSHKGGGPAIVNTGYSFLFAPPGIPGYASRAASVNVELLAIELLVTFAIGWLLIRFVAKE